MSLDDVIKDLSALGGLPFYAAAMLTLLLSQQYGPFWQLVIGIVIAYAVIAGVRSVFIRDRPKPVSYRTWWQKIDAGTAVSMHAMRGTILAIVLMDVFRNIWLSTFLVALALVVSGTRFWLKKHYIADVAWGIGIGIVIGLIVLWAV
ncbi:phosphatase PAP2 family protein [Candidatus Woesearchaeota archaeon]|nr:phosphatase PAP2 family protein [Candidatus Woesearchaeota archaeon]